MGPLLAIKELHLSENALRLPDLEGTSHLVSNFIQLPGFNDGHLAHSQDHRGGVGSFGEVVSRVPLLRLGVDISLIVEEIARVVAFLLDLLHEGLQEQRFGMDGLHLEVELVEEGESELLEERLVDDDEQPVERLRWKEVHDLLFNHSIPKLLLPIDLIGMGSNLSLYFLLDVFPPQFAEQLEMVESAVEVVGEHRDHDPQDLGHDVAEDEGDDDECEDGVDALDRILGGDVTVGDGGDDGDAVVHDVGVHLLPVEDERHLVESPAVVDPGEVGSVGPVVVVLVDPAADHEEEDAHVVRVDVAEDDKLEHQVPRVQQDLQLRHPLELNIDLAHHMDLPQPEQLQPVRLQVSRRQRHHHHHHSHQVDPEIHGRVPAADDAHVLDEQSLVVEGLQGRDEDVGHQDEDEDDVKGDVVVELVVPEGGSEAQQQSDLQQVEQDHAHHQELPAEQPPVARPHHQVQSPVEIDEPLPDRLLHRSLRAVPDGLQHCRTHHPLRESGGLQVDGVGSHQELAEAVFVNFHVDNNVYYLQIRCKLIQSFTPQQPTEQTNQSNSENITGIQTVAPSYVWRCPSTLAVATNASSGRGPEAVSVRLEGGA